MRKLLIASAITLGALFLGTEYVPAQVVGCKVTVTKYLIDSAGYPVVTPNRKVTNNSLTVGIPRYPEGRDTDIKRTTASLEVSFKTLDTLRVPVHLNDSCVLSLGKEVGVFTIFKVPLVPTKLEEY